MRITDWSSDVCSSDRHNCGNRSQCCSPNDLTVDATWRYIRRAQTLSGRSVAMWGRGEPSGVKSLPVGASVDMKERRAPACGFRSEEHTSELQSLMRISYAVFCLKQKINKATYTLLLSHITLLL